MPDSFQIKNPNTVYFLTFQVTEIFLILIH